MSYDAKLLEIDEQMRALERPQPPVVRWLAEGQKGDLNARTAAWKRELAAWEQANPEGAVEWLRLRELYLAEEETLEARKWSADENRYRLLAKLGAPQVCIDVIRREFEDKPAMKSANAWARSGEWSLVMCGGVGNGKTTAATWACHQFMSRGYRAHWVRCSAMVDASLFGAEAELTRFRCREAGVLVLDDIGAGAREQGAKAWLGWLDDVLDARWANRRKTIITTNMPAGALASWLGMRLADRLNEGVIFSDTSKSMRGSKNAQQGPQPPQIQAKSVEVHP